MPNSTSTEPKQCPCKVCVHERSLHLVRRICMATLLVSLCGGALSVVLFAIALLKGVSVQAHMPVVLLWAALAFGSNWLGKLLTDCLNLVGEFRSIAAKYLVNEK